MQRGLYWNKGPYNVEPNHAQPTTKGLLSIKLWFDHFIKQFQQAFCYMNHPSNSRGKLHWVTYPRQTNTQQNQTSFLQKNGSCDWGQLAALWKVDRSLRRHLIKNWKVDSVHLIAYFQGNVVTCDLQWAIKTSNWTVCILIIFLDLNKG
jgi:hypothetical protein